MKKFISGIILFWFIFFGNHYLCGSSSIQEGSMKQEEQNKMTTGLVPEMYDRDINKADEIFHPQCIHHINGTTEESTGPDAIKQSIIGMKNAFSDFKTTIDDKLAENDKVAFRWTWQGKHRASGKIWTFHGNTFFRFKDGKVVEEWAIDDRLREMKAQGFTITPPTPPQK
jgi:predicted ester cyclase